MKLKLYELLNKSFWGCLIIVVFFSSIKDQQVIQYPPLTKSINYLFPQGWGFFTRNPREDNVYAYRLKDNKIEEINLLNQSVTNFFGFSRSTRLKAFDLAILMEKINNKSWVRSSNPNINSHINLPITKVKRTNNLQFFSEGIYFIKLKKTIPWKWSNLNQEKYTPYQIVKIKIYE